MKLVALLSWYDEQSAFIEAALGSLAWVGVDEIVALDGAYELFPFGQPRSPESNYEALARSPIPVHVRTPDSCWPTEMDKRTTLFRLGEELTSERDWFFVTDADNVVIRCDCDLKRLLRGSSCDAGTVRFEEPRPNGPISRFTLTSFFRAQRGITVGPNHYTYTAPDGTVLWGGNRRRNRVRKLKVPLTIEHRSFYREAGRFGRAFAYYRKRDKLKLEFGSCEVDGCEVSGHVELPTDWQLEREGKLTAEWMTVCAAHEPEIRERNRQAIRAHGLDPETAQVTFEKVGA